MSFGLGSFLSRHRVKFVIIAAVAGFIYGVATYQIAPFDRGINGHLSHEIGNKPIPIEIQIAKYALWTAIASMCAAVVGLLTKIIELLSKRK